MAVFQTYTAIGNLEDLSPVVTRIAVEETPLLSSIKKTKATGVKHEWITETLESPGFNAQVEGSDATFPVITPRVRDDNQCQIIRKTGLISRTQEAVMKAGVASEYAHQLEKATKELARDTERLLWQGAKSVGSASVARTSEGIYSFVSTNRQSMSNLSGADVADTSQGGGGASTMVLASGGGAGSADGDHYLLTGGTGAGQYRIQTGAASTDTVTVTEAWDVQPDNTSTYIHYTVPVALTDAVLNDGIQACKDAGGNPKTMYVSGNQKRAISALAFSKRQFIDGAKTLTNTVDLYDSDFGPLKVKYDRWVPAGSVAILDETYFATAFLRPIVAEELAPSGSARKFMIEGELCLESKGETASSIVNGCAL
ncbi:DUF5309 family protein [Candidatus Pacearchaeota archaeon]|nr:DUF5309 family protein [Candidatus Pacearchaeota archaeon]